MSRDRKPKSFSTNLIAGGVAGCMEAVVCHPLDTIKVRMQLKSRSTGPKLSFIGVGAKIVRVEGPLALYKGLGAVVSGIIPKMAIRFSSFGIYKSWGTDADGKTHPMVTFLAGLAAGTTEAVMVVTPMDVIKIRLQAQRHSMADPLDIPKYRNAGHAAYTIVKEEGFATLWKGVTLTALRQATNQGVNFAVYQEMKKSLLKRQPQYQGKDELPSIQTLIIGGLSGAMGPLCNAPIDTVKTRIQKASAIPGESGWQRFTAVVSHITKHEGYAAFYKGLTPRILRVAPGQAITFMVYEKVAYWLGNLHFRPEEEHAASNVEI